MNVVVFAKWVPLGTPELGEDRRLVRGRDDGLDAGDEFGIELALQLTERDGGEVTVVSMGPEGAVAAIQRALAMGAHRGILVTDDALAGADALATARVLAAAARRQPFDLVVGGVESSDGYTGTVPATVAELLGPAERHVRARGSTSRAASSAPSARPPRATTRWRAPCRRSSR